MYVCVCRGIPVDADVDRYMERCDGPISAAEAVGWIPVCVLGVCVCVSVCICENVCECVWREPKRDRFHVGGLFAVKGQFVTFVN